MQNNPQVVPVRRRTLTRTGQTDIESLLQQGGMMHRLVLLLTSSVGTEKSIRIMAPRFPSRTVHNKRPCKGFHDAVAFSIVVIFPIMSIPKSDLLPRTPRQLWKQDLKS